MAKQDTNKPAPKQAQAKKVAKKAAKKRAVYTTLAFIAVSRTAAARVRTFPVSPGFNESAPRARLDALLAGAGGYKGFVATTDGSRVAVRKLKKAKATA